MHVSHMKNLRSLAATLSNIFCRYRLLKFKNFVKFKEERDSLTEVIFKNSLIPFLETLHFMTVQVWSLRSEAWIIAKNII